MSVVEREISVISIRVDGLVAGDKIQPGRHPLATVNHVKKVGRFIVCKITANNKKFVIWFLSGDKINKVE